MSDHVPKEKYLAEILEKCVVGLLPGHSRYVASWVNLLLVIQEHRPAGAQAFPEFHGLQGQDVSGRQEEVTDSMDGIEGQDGVCFIGLIYKDRCAIEQFFRWIKQNLKIKTFIGRSENAVLTQIYVALIVYLLLSIMKHMSKIGQSLQQILQIMQLHLMEKVSIEDLFRPPEIIKNNIKFRLL